MISSSSSSGISKIGVAPETVTVLTNTLSATTTVNITTLILLNEETVIDEKFGKKALITGPVLSSFTMDKVRVDDDVLLLISVAEKVYVSSVLPKL